MLNVDIGYNTNVRSCNARKHPPYTNISNKLKRNRETRRQALRQLRKTRSKNLRKDEAYISGAFSKKSAPDVDLCHNEVLITFVDDSEVMLQ